MKRNWHMTKEKPNQGQDDTGTGIEEKMAHEPEETRSKTKRHWHRDDEKMAHGKGETHSRTRRHWHRNEEKMNTNKEKPTLGQEGEDVSQTRRNRHEYQKKLV